MSRNVLLIGNGGRETAIAMKLLKSGAAVYAPQRNAWMERHLRPFPSTVTEICTGEVSYWNAFRAIDLVVVGPEAPLASGIVDQLLTHTQCRVFGPRQRLAELETSKSNTKNLMRRLGIPTAPGRWHDKYDALRRVDRMSRRDFQEIVLKFDGLLNGKGVALPETREDAIAHIESCFKGHNPNEEFILFEERLHGTEVSLMIFADGDNSVICPPTMDYKRAYDGNPAHNPMTGSMGAIAPAPIIENGKWETLGQRLAEPIMREARRIDPERGFRGCLKFDLMITDDGSPYVLEINVRMGDPETQAILPLIKVSAYDLFHACATGTLQELVGKEGLGKMLPYYGCSVAVAVTSESYPDPHQGDLIRLPVPGERLPIYVDLLHANTQPDENGQAASTGGRIIYVCGYGDDHSRARSSAYSYLQEAGFTNVRWRTDIGANIPTVNLKL